MSIYHRIMSLVVLFLLLQNTPSCLAGLTISQPAEGRKHLTTPADLVISQTGCSTLGPGDIKTWIDHVDQGQFDITDKFTFQNGTWAGLNIDLPLGSQTLTVDWVSMQPAPICLKGQTVDSRSFTVYEPACIRGTVLAANFTNGPKEPLSGATIVVSLSQDGEIVGQAKSDKGGYFCIDTIPIGFLVNIQVNDLRIKDFTIKSFDPAATGPRSCQQPELCPNVTCQGIYIEQ